MFVSLRSNLPGVAEGAVSVDNQFHSVRLMITLPTLFFLNYQEEYQRMMHEKYPEASNSLPFDEEVWMKATGPKKGYVKGIGQKRTRPSSFSECTSASSAVAGSTATSPAPTSQQQAQEMITAIIHDPSLMEQLKAALANAQGQSSQASCNNGPHEVTHYK